MPAFTFEKITPPAELESSGPIASTVRRGALMRFINRLTSTRLQKSGGDKVEQLKRKYRKQR
jgi:hypothetical protein